MALNRARALWGAQTIEVSIQMSRTPGIVPDRGVLTCPLNDTQPVNNIDTLRLQWGNDTDGWTDVMVWPACRLSRFQEARGNYLDARYTVEDRRWRWRYPWIIGNYNVRDEAGNVIPETARNPQELATLLLNAMGESSFDVSVLPTDDALAPEVSWLYANAALELRKLCEQFGCDIHPNRDDSVWIKARGTGTVPSSTNLIYPVTAGLAMEQPPEELHAYAADTLFDSWLILEPCCPELDATPTSDNVKDIEDLSFKPAGGWGTCDPERFLAVEGLTDDMTKRLRAHCQKYMWRMFRVAGFAGGATKPPGFDEDLDPDDDPWPDVTDMKLLTPLLSTRLAAGEDENGNLRRLPAEIAGSWSQHGTLTSINTPSYTIWSHGFRIDTNNAFVYLNRPAFRVPDVRFAYDDASARVAETGYTPTAKDTAEDALFRQKDDGSFWTYNTFGGWLAAPTAGIQPPVLVLRCGYGLRQNRTGPRYHHTFVKPTGATNGTGSEALRKTEYQRICIEDYSSDYQDLSSIGTHFDNKATVEAALEAAIDEYVHKYQPTVQPQTGQYSEPYDLETDGLVQQISYVAGAETEFVQTVSVAYEHDRSQLPAWKRVQAETERIAQEQELQQFTAQKNHDLILQQVIFPMQLMGSI